MSLKLNSQIVSIQKYTSKIIIILFPPHPSPTLHTPIWTSEISTPAKLRTKTDYKIAPLLCYHYLRPKKNYTQ